MLNPIWHLICGGFCRGLRVLMEPVEPASPGAAKPAVALLSLGTTTARTTVAMVEDSRTFAETVG